MQRKFLVYILCLALTHYFPDVLNKSCGLFSDFKIVPVQSCHIFSVSTAAGEVNKLSALYLACIPLHELNVLRHVIQLSYLVYVWHIFRMIGRLKLKISFKVYCMYIVFTQDCRRCSISCAKWVIVPHLETQPTFSMLAFQWLIYSVSACFDSIFLKQPPKVCHWTFKMWPFFSVSLGAVTSQELPCLWALFRVTTILFDSILAFVLIILAADDTVMLIVCVCSSLWCFLSVRPSV